MKRLLLTIGLAGFLGLNSCAMNGEYSYGCPNLYGYVPTNGGPGCPHGDWNIPVWSDGMGLAMNRYGYYIFPGNPMATACILCVQPRLDGKGHFTFPGQNGGAEGWMIPGENNPMPNRDPWSPGEE